MRIWFVATTKHRSKFHAGPAGNARPRNMLTTLKVAAPPASPPTET